MNPCWVLMCRFSPNRTKCEYESPQHTIQKKCHGDGIKESTRNHKFVQHTPLRSHLLTIPTIHLRKNCKKSQKRLPHRICKQHQAWTNIQHSKLKTEKKKKGSLKTRFHHPNRENLHTYNGYLQRSGRNLTRVTKKKKETDHNLVRLQNRKTHLPIHHVEMIDSFHQSKLRLLPTNRKVCLNQPKGGIIHMYRRSTTFSHHLWHKTCKEIRARERARSSTKLESQTWLNVARIVSRFWQVQSKFRGEKRNLTVCVGEIRATCVRMERWRRTSARRGGGRQGLIFPLGNSFRESD
jgi:hypothetical protein